MTRATLAAHIFTVTVLLLWSVASLYLPGYVMPSPAEVATKILELMTDYNNLRHGLYSLFHVLTALIVAFMIGVLLSATAHYLRFTNLMIHGRLNRFMNSFSALGWTFLAIIWFGINDFTVVFAMTAVLLPLVIINLREGFLQLDLELIEMAQSFSRRGVRNFFKITLPLLAPYIAATIRIAFSVAWIISLAVELFGGSAGYGYLLNRARHDYQLAMIIAIIFVIIFIVYATERFILSPVHERFRRQYVS